MDEIRDEKVPDDQRPASSSDWQSLIDNLDRDHKGECPYPCPFCMAAGFVRQVNPDVANHLAAAGREFLLAARAFIEAVQSGSYSSPRDTGEVERIPIE